MRIRSPWLCLVAAFLGCLMLLNAVLLPVAASAQEPQASSSQQQRLVGEVQIEGNRRLRDDDVLYHIQTRKGDVYNPAQVQRDLQALLNLPFFHKTETRVTIIDPGPLGGIVVRFEVKELPVIRDLQFKGLKSIGEADVLKAFREQRVGVTKESVYDPVKINNAKRVIKELLSEHGHPNATIDANTEEVSQTSVALTFNVDEGDRVRVVEIAFEGNQHFSD